MFLPALPTPRLLRLLTLLLAGSLAGCQSVRPAFQFRPAGSPLVKGMSAPRAELLPLTPAMQQVLASAEKACAEEPMPGLKSARPREPRTPLKRQVKAVTSFARQLHGVAAGRLTRTQSAPAPMRRHQAAPPTAAVAENGLGTMFLGILGIVALLVGLIGLLIAGGAFFGLLAVGGAVALLLSIVVPILMGWGG